MITIHKVFIDIRNYYNLRKIIKKESITSPIWAKNNLRYDMLGRIYTVYNLPPEVTKSPDIPEDAWIAYVLEQAKPLNEYLTSLNLQEIIVPKYTRIPDTESFLLMYKPAFMTLGWDWVIKRILFWAGIWMIEHKFHTFSSIFEWVKNIL